MSISLARYERDQANADMREEAIEQKKIEVQEMLLSVTDMYGLAFVTDSKGCKIEFSDFVADVEIDDCSFAEFLKEGFYSNGSHFRNQMLEELDKFCEGVATELIDNMEQDNENY